ncbi:MAG: hypothetical protein ICV64_01895 [Thermoleophilia bacterium]|nr:hypothetical protein [Thermoleophilia bacterium]
MSARARLFLVVALSAVAASGAAVGVALLQRDDSAAAFSPPSGDPPLVLALGVRTDPEARALRRATGLYNDGRRREAARVFARYDSLEARIGSALARWPAGTLAVLRELVREYPDSGGARLHLGFALLWSGRPEDAVAAWRAARRVEPDSPYALRAEDVLFPNVFRGRPPFVPSFAAPRLPERPPARQLAALERAAREGGVRAKLSYGVALQALERPLSARRQYQAALALAPRDPEVQTAVAVASFDKARPRAAFASLGPLTRTHPRSATVRFHLGVLLAWLGDRDGALRQLERARTLAPPGSRLSVEANRFIRGLVSTEASPERD